MCRMRVGERQPGHRFADVAELGGRAFEELLADRHVVEQMADFEPGAGAPFHGRTADSHAVIDANLGAAVANRAAAIAK